MRVLPPTRQLLISSVLSAILAGTAIAGDCPVFAAGVAGGNVTDPALVEASGLAASRSAPGTLWAHNDSGASAMLFAIATDGAALATVNLTDAANFDWEDIALGPGPEEGVDYLYIGDIGDNLAMRSSVTIYRVPEPALGEQGQTIDLTGAVALHATYPDGARDAETLLADPVTGDLYIVSKASNGESRVYRHAFPQADDVTVELEAVTDLPFPGPNFLVRSATGGDIAPDGGAIAIRTYTHAYLWPRGPAQSVAQALAGSACALPIELELQGEALGFAADGESYFTLSEQAFQPIYEFVRVPEPARWMLELAALATAARARRSRATRYRAS